MWLSMLSVWGSLLTLVASQSCLDPSENSASWMRLKPLGQCKDGESTCPYRITLPPLTVQLPKSFRELEKMARELRSLTQMVNQLKEDCRECKLRQGLDWNVRRDDEGEDGERIQASRGTLNTRERQQDISKRESTVQVTTSRSAVEDTMIISSDAKDINPTAFGKQMNANQERNVNPRTTKPRAETDRGPKGFKTSEKNPISRSMSKVGEVPSRTTTKKKILQSPLDKLTESTFPGDLDSEQPTQHEKHKTNTMKVGHEVYPSGTLTAKGKVKSIPEYHVVTIVTEDDDDDVKTKLLQTPKGDKALGERQLVTGIDAENNRELEPNMKQLTGKQQDKEDKKEFADTGLKESRSNIFDDINNGNVAKEGSVSVIQQPTLKNKEKMEKNNQGASSTKLKPLKPGVYSERDTEMNSRPVNTDDTIRGQKKIMSPITGRANASVNVSQINPQSLEFTSETAFKPDTDAKMETLIESKFNTAETVSGQATSRSPTSGIIYGIVDVSPTNPQTLDSKKQFIAGIDSESDAGMNSNPVNNVDTVSGLNNSRSPNSGRANVTADVDLINPKIQKSNFQTPFKSGTDAESNTGMDSNPVNGLKNSRSPISGITDGIVDVSPTNPQILDSKYQFQVGTDSESYGEIDSNPVNNTETVSGLKNSRSPISDRANATVDVDLIRPKQQSSNSQTSLNSSKNPEHNTGMDSNPVNKIETVNGQETSRSPISGITDDRVDASPTNLQILDSKNQIRTGTDSEIDAVMDSNPVNNVDTVSGLKNSSSPISRRVNATADVNLINPIIQSSSSQTSLQYSRDTESNTGMNSNPVNGLKNSRSPISSITDGIADVSPTNPQIVHSKNQVKAGTNSGSDARVDSNPVNNVEKVSGQEASRSPISGITDGIVDVSPTNVQILDSKNQIRTGIDSESDAGMNSNPVNNVDTVSGLNKSRSFISDRANSTADIDLINPQSHPVNTSEIVSQLQMPKSNISDIIDAVEVNQTYPGTQDGTFKNPLKPGSDKEKKVEMDSTPLNKVETSPLEMPQLSMTDRAGATVNVYQINPQMVYSNSENTFNPATYSEREATVVSTPVNTFETVSQLETPKLPISATADQINPQDMDYISKNPLKPSTISERKAGIYPNQDHTTDTVSQRETSESPLSDSRLAVSGTNPSLNSNNDLPKRRFLTKSKFNITRPRNGQIKSSNPVSIDTERKKVLRNNKTLSLRSDAMKSGRHLPTGLSPMRLEKQQEITNQPERTGPTGESLSKDPRHRKPYILQRIPVNKSKALGSGGPENTTGVTDYMMSNGTTHFDSKTVSSPNNLLNSTAYDMSQSVRPTLTTQGIVDQAHIKRAKNAPIVKVLNAIFNRQIESTSQTTVTKPRLEKPGGSSGQDRVLDTVNNIGRDSQPLVVEQTKGTNRRTGKTPFRTSSVDSNQENHKKPLREGRIQTPVEKMPLAVVSSERNELNYPTTAATPYTVKTEFKNNHSKMPQFTPPIIKTPHFMDQDRAEQAKTTSGVKVSNKHVHNRLENPSQEIESKRSHSDTGNKELQSASNGQRSGAVTDLQPNSLDSIQNRAIGSMAIIMDIVKASTGSKVSTTSTESTNENRARDTNPVVMDKVEASTEANRLTPSSDNAPVPYNRYSKTPLGPADSVEGNNGGHSVDNNNGNSYPVAVNRMSGATLHKSPAGHTNNGNNKKPLTVNNMDDRHGLEKQLLSKCDGQCDLGPTPQSILNSHESSNNDRDKTSQDCSDFIMRNPTNGIYNVTPTGSDNRTFPVFCDMKSSGGGWTLIQHRFDGSTSFNRTWNDYKRGFGNLTGEFWLGNDKIHWLTTTKPMVLRIELEDLDGMKEYAQYDHFHVANESQYYRLTIEGYSGTAGDAMQYSKKFNHNQKNFTTPDRDNDQYTSGNCGAYYSSGWWFDACLAANLNGKYYETRYRGVRNGIFWGTWHNISTESYLTHDRQSFKTVRMMIRPRTMLLMN